MTTPNKPQRKEISKEDWEKIEVELEKMKQGSEDMKRLYEEMFGTPLTTK